MAIYVTPTHPNYYLSVVVGGKKVRLDWKHCQFSTDDEDVIQALDAVLASNPRIARTVHKADKTVAEKLAREHQARIGAAGVRGPVTSQSLNHMRHGAVEAEAAKLQQLGGSELASHEVAEALSGRSEVNVGVDSAISPSGSVSLGKIKKL